MSCRRFPLEYPTEFAAALKDVDWERIGRLLDVEHFEEAARQLRDHLSERFKEVSGEEPVGDDSEYERQRDADLERATTIQK